MKRAIGGLILIAALTLSAAGPASASCLAPADPQAEFRNAVATNPIVFVGTVMGTQAQGRSAIVNVVEVWRGPEFPAQVVVNGSDSVESGAITSIDRNFTAGTKYLFVPQGNHSPFIDNACSFTTEFTPDVEKLRPAGARTLAGPPADPASGGFPTVPVTLGSIGGLALILATWLMLRRRSPAAQSAEKLG